MTPVEAVQRHLEAVRSFEWDALEASMTKDAVLIWQSASAEHPQASAPQLYRAISQAWDFMPKGFELHDRGGGLVDAKLHLTNGTGGGWSKEVRGRYRVLDERICEIVLCDAFSFDIGNS